MCPIVVLVDLSICFLITFSVRACHILRKPFLIAFMRLAFVGLKSTAWRYCASSGLVVWSRMSFATISVFFCLQENLSHSCLIVLGAFYYLLSNFFGIYCFYIVMVQPSSHRTPNYNSGAVLILRKCESTLPVCLGLVSEVSIYLTTSL